MTTPPACPRCNTPLAAPPPDRPGSWVCAGCAGLWLETDAFERVCSELATVTPPETLPPRRADDAAPAVCPSCSSVMSRVDVGGARGVTIDVCRRHGVWLDAGELDSVMRLGRTEELIRLQVAQRLAPLLERYAQTPLFANLSVDRGPDPLARRVAMQGMRELLDLLAELLHMR